MHRQRPLHSLLHALIGTIVLAVAIRTWLVMGLVAPVTVSGSSMAPTLRGEHLRIACPQCEAEILMGAEFTADVSGATCSQCGKPGIALDGSTIDQGDPLLIDRQSLDWRPLKRGELVVLHDPTNGEQLCVKRVWGLPGETVELVHGDLFIDGKGYVKSLDQQLAMRQFVHRESPSTRRWQADDAGLWNWRQNLWGSEADGFPRIHWLHYQHPGDRSITDDNPCNANLTRRLHAVSDLMLSCQVRLQGNGSLVIQLRTDSLCQVELNVTERSVAFQIDDLQSREFDMPARLLTDLQTKGVPLTLSNFDRQLMLCLGNSFFRTFPMEELDRPAPATSRPIAIGAKGISVELSELTIYRDVYFTPQAVGAAPPFSSVTELGPSHYFLLGDNPPVSLDSRTWGGVPDRLFVGRPLGVR